MIRRDLETTASERFPEDRVETVLVHGGEQSGDMRGTTLVPWRGIDDFDWAGT